MDADVVAQLSGIATKDSSERAAAYADVLDQVLQASEGALPGLLHTYVQHAAFSRVNTAGAGLLVGRQVIVDLHTKLNAAHTLPSHALASSEVLCDVLSGIITLCNASPPMYDDELVPLRIFLADQYEVRHMWVEAARTLQSITPDALRRAPHTSWAQLCVHIVQLWLHALPSCLDEALDALKRANSSIYAERDNAALVHELSLCYVRICTAQRRFADAAARYLELGSAPNASRDMVEHAAALAIIAAPCTQRTQMLAQLARDPDATSWTFGPALQNALNGRFLREEHLTTLTPLRHMGIVTDAHVFVEHNVCVALSLFTSISLAHLARLAGLEANAEGVRACEEAVAQLIRQEILPFTCWIDQVQQVVYTHDPALANTARESRIATSLHALHAAHAHLSMRS